MRKDTIIILEVSSYFLFVWYILLLFWLSSVIYERKHLYFRDKIQPCSQRLYRTEHAATWMSIILVAATFRLRQRRLKPAATDVYLNKKRLTKKI